MKDDTYLVSGLQRLHRELARDLSIAQAEADRIRQNIHHVEAVLQIVRPGASRKDMGILRRHVGNGVFKRGDLLRNGLMVLGAAARPMTSDEIAMAVLIGAGIDEPDRKQLYKVWNSLHSGLRRSIGRTVECDKSVHPMRWRLLE